jgi:DNA-binding MarR family transcriptional regulator
MSQRRLADLMHVQPITVSRLVDRLEAAGFAERRADPNDRRANEIHLTPKGRTAARKIRSVNDVLADQLSAQLDPKELAGLLHGLGVIREALEQMR